MFMTSGLFPWLVSIALPGAVGWGILRGFGWERGWPVPLQGAVGWLCGLLWLGWGMFLAGLLGLSWSLSGLTLWLGAGPLLAWLAGKKGQNSVGERKFERSKGWLGLFLPATVIALVLGMLATRTLLLPMAPGDPASMWGYRGKAFFLAHTFPFAFHERHLHLHTLHHPPLMPLLEAWEALWQGAFAEGWVGLGVPFVLGLAALLIYGLARLDGWGRTGAGWWAAGALSLPILLARGHEGYADPLFAVYLLLAFRGLLTWGEEASHPGRLLLLGSLGLLWTKAEGVPLVLIAGGILAGMERGRLLQRPMLPGLGGVALAGWLPWAVMKAVYDLRSYELSFGFFSTSRLGEAINRSPGIAAAFGWELWGSGHWAVTWYLLPLAVWLSRRTLPPRERWSGGMFLVLALLMYGAVYCLVAVDPRLLMGASLPRIILPLALAAWSWTARILAPKDAAGKKQPVPGTGE